MAEKLYQQFVEMFNKMELPASDDISDDQRDLFEEGCDVMLLYRGHPDVLMRALRLFQTTDCRPYVCAGAAKILDAASYISGGSYDKDGINEALRWLANARHFAPNRFEIKIIEPGIYGNLNQLKSMRQQLDKLRDFSEAYTSFRYAITEMWYWDKVNDLTQIKYWNDESFKRAQNDIQRLFALNTLAGTLLRKRMMREALALYHDVVKINPNDAWAWHNMSIIYLEAGDYANAGGCNDRALNIMNFGAARGVLSDLIDRWSKSRNPDILDDIPPYLVQNDQSRQNESQSFFKKLLGN